MCNSAMRSTNIIRFLGACFSPPDYLIVMEYAERGTLHAVLSTCASEISPMKRIAMLLVCLIPNKTVVVCGIQCDHSIV